MSSAAVAASGGHQWTRFTSPPPSRSSTRAPHLGHALEFVQTDVARPPRPRPRPDGPLPDRHRRARGQERAGGRGRGRCRSPRSSRATRRCSATLADTLEVSYDDFIRTSADPRHRPVVEDDLATRARARGDLYRAAVRGRYCAGCEEFRRRRRAPSTTRRSSGSRRRTGSSGSRATPSRIRAAIARRPLRIDPPRARATRCSAFLDGRRARHQRVAARARASATGASRCPAIPSSSSTCGSTRSSTTSAPRRHDWWSDGRDDRAHVIGKGIVRFHAVIWPAILLSAGLPLPDELFVHDYVTADGRKIGKSLGNAVDPDRSRRALRRRRAALVAAARGAARRRDRLHRGRASSTTANRDLANGVGNLVQRVVGLGGAAGRRAGARRRTVVALPRSRSTTRSTRFDLRARRRGAIVAEVGRGEPRDRDERAVDADG